jgi:DNA modification methylase
VDAGDVGNPSPPLRQDVGNVLSFKPVTVADRDHPTEKPVALLETLLSVVCPPRGHVIDPFMGVGTVGSAARRLGLSFTGCELAEGFYRQARSRLINSPVAAAESNAITSTGGQLGLL